jgi:uncharacterized protein YdcH (DUF465 family)
VRERNRDGTKEGGGMTDAQLPVRNPVKDTLLRTDDGFRQLVQEHQALDERIRQLSSLNYPTDQQRYEEISLKKKKLALKDRIEAIVRGHLQAPPLTQQ